MAVQGIPSLHPAGEVGPLHFREAAGSARRVIVVIASLNMGGAERFACELARQWSLRGHEVTLLTWWNRSVDQLAVPPGVDRIALDVGERSASIVRSVAHAGQTVLALRRAIVASMPHVVVSFLHHTNELTILATAGTGIPVLACERSDPRHDGNTRRWALARRVLYPRAAGVVVQTESVGAWVRSFCPKVYVIPNFIRRPTHLASPAVEEGRRKLIAMGRLAPEKGFDLLIEAFSLISRDCPDWTLVILGEGGERGSLESLVAARRLQGRVSLPGRSDQPELELAAAHAFAMPSRYEGFPNALLEAMACGLPVVAFDCESGPADIVRHGHDGILVPAGDVAAMAAALAQVMNSSAVRSRLGLNATQIVERLAPERILEAWSELLDSVDRRPR